MRVKRDVSRWMMSGFVACVGAVGLFYSKDSPAPPPPIGTCSSGVPASLVIQYASAPLAVALNSHLAALQIQPLNAAGNPLHDVPITFTVPASGPSGTFNVFTDPDTQANVPTPNPLMTTVSTSSTCGAAAPVFIANNTLGDYQITVTSGPITLQVATSNVATAAVSAVNVFGANQIAHVNTPFRQPWWAQTVLGTSGEVAGIPVTFNVPTSGPSGTFSDGSSSATVLTNAFGRAYGPVLTANDAAGQFNVTAQAPGTLPIAGGPFTNAGPTITTMEPFETPSTTAFGQTVTMAVHVTLIGYSGGPSQPSQNPGGNVVLKSDGIVIASNALADNRFSAPCTYCTDIVLTFYIATTTIPFGTHQLTAEYQSGGLYDSSASAPIAQTVVPEFIGPTADAGVQSAIGITTVAPSFACKLSGAEWTSVANAGAASPPGYTVPLGLFRYRIDTCRYELTTLGMPLPPVAQVLVLQFSEPLPIGAVFLSYGTTSDNASPHWYQLPSQVDGNVMTVALGDGGPGDDDLTQNGIIVGLGGPAVAQGQAPVSNANYQGLWWNAPAGSESGWGISFAHQDDVIFASWFTYGPTGKGWWLTMTAPHTTGNSFSGTIYQTTGPAFDALPFDPKQIVPMPVGSGTLSFADASNGSFSYTVNGIAQTKSITREVFGTLPTCTFNALNDLSTATNYQDLWWNSPPGSESGWGVNIAHESDTIFATWFTYDLDGSPMWLAATANRTLPGTYTGDLFRTTGPAFNAMPFDPAAVQRTKVGSATLSFIDGNRGTFAYTVNGISQTKAITREVFRTPGTICR